MVEASTTHVSVRQAQTLRGHQAGTSSADCGARGGEQHNRGAELWRNAVPLVCPPPPPVAARAQLNVSDDMTRARKNAHSSRGGFE